MPTNPTTLYSSPILYMSPSLLADGGGPDGEAEGPPTTVAAALALAAAALVQADADRQSQGLWVGGCRQEDRE